MVGAIRKQEHQAGLLRVGPRQETATVTNQNFFLVKIILLCLLRFLDFYQTNKSHSFVTTFSTGWRFSPNARTWIIDFFWRYFHVSTYNTDDNDDTDKSSPPDGATVKWIVSAVNNPGTNTTWSKYSNNR